MVRGVSYRRWVKKLALASTALWLAGCDSELITLGLAGTDGGGSGGSPGVRPSVRLTFGEPVLREELGAPGAKDDNPTLTADARTVFFTSTRGDASHVYTATRPTLDDPFSDPVPVEAVNQEAESSSPAISLDGLSLWVGQERDGGSGNLDIWVTTRTTRAGGFGELENVSALNSQADDIPRPPAQNRVMPLGSRRAELGGDYRTYLATRAGELDEFAAPVAIPELENGKRVVDGFLTEDLLRLFFSSGIGEDAGDLYLAERATEHEAFGPPQRLEISTGDDERDPWLSVDETRFFFSSNRSGDHEIFESIVSPN
jgi:hypothetical protein